MTVRPEAFLSIEASLIDRLTQDWRRVAAETGDAINTEVKAGNFDAAYALANSLDLSPVYEKNREYIKYVTYAALAFGATRLTDNARDTVVARGDLKEVVSRAQEQFRIMLEYSVTEQVRDELVQLIALEEGKVQKFDPSQPRDDKGRWTDGNVEAGKVGYVWSGSAPSILDFPGKFDGNIVFSNSLSREDRQRMYQETVLLQRKFMEEIEKTSSTARKSELNAAVSALLYTRNALTPSYDSKVKTLLALGKDGRLSGGLVISQQQDGSYVLDYLGSLQRGAGVRLLSSAEKWVLGRKGGTISLVSTPYATKFYEAHGYRRNWEGFFEKQITEQTVIRKQEEEEPLGVLCITEGYEKSAQEDITKKERNPYHKPPGNSDGGEFTSGSEVGYSFSKEKDTWLDQEGKPIPAEDRARLKEIGMPPAYIGVWLNPDPNAALQAYGYSPLKPDKKQPFYSKEHSEKAAAEKFARGKEFHEALPKIRSALLSRIQDPSLSQRERDAAAVLRMIERTGIRIGGDDDTGAKAKAYGASTLLNSHVSFSGDRIKLSFPGKHGVLNTRSFEDPVLAQYIRERKGKKTTGRLFDVSDSFVRSEFDRMGFGDFLPKDFRTWHATAQALLEIKRHAVPKNEKEMKKLRSVVAKRVASFLGNTPAVALKSYIDPTVFPRKY